MRGTRWPAVRAVGAHELRRRWRALVVLGLVAGLVGAVVLSSVQLTRRTASAPERIAAATQVDDARVVLYGGQADPDDVTSLPGVAHSRVLQMGVGQISGSELGFTSISAGPTSEHVFTPVVVEGRAPDPAAADEAMVAEEFAQFFGLSVGEVVELSMLTPDELNSFDTGFGLPDGPRVQLRITGMARLSRDFAGGNGISALLSTPAFGEAHGEVLPITTVMLRLEDTSAAGKRRFEQSVAELSEGLQSVAGGEEFPPLAVEFPRAGGGSAVLSARAVLVAGLGVLIAVSALTGLLGVAQALSRHHASGAAAQRVEAALGLTGRERALARALPALLGGLVAAAVAAAGTLASARLEPLGALRAYEPEPGWLPDWPVVVAGSAALVLAFAVLAAVTAARTLRASSAATAAVGRSGRLRLPGTRHAPLLAGTAFALGRGRAGVPVRATLVAAALGVAGIVAAATFAASLDRLATTPERYGWAAHFAWIDAKDPELVDIAARDDVAGVTLLQDSSVQLDGRAVPAYAAQVRKGDSPWTVLSGRVPEEPGEVALGQRLAHRLGVEVGDRLELTASSGEPVPQRVVGVLVVPSLAGERFNEVLVLTPDDLTRAAQTQPFNAALVTGTDGDAADAVYDDLAASLELVRRSLPTDVSNLVDLGRLPVALGVFLALLSGAVLAHALVLTTRRRAGDLAVLRVIGFTPRQVGGTLVAMAGTTSVVGLLVGLPLGLALGRVVWAEVAAEVGVAGDVAVPWAVLLVLPPVVVVVALLLALLPARRAALVSPATVLRAE